MSYRVVLDGHDILDFTDEDKKLILLDPHLSMELNTAGSLEFTMPPMHTYYNSVQPLKSNVEVYEDNTMIWFGRVAETTVDFYKQKRVYCEGPLSYFCDSVQKQHAYENMGMYALFSAFISNHNSMVGDDRKFYIGSVTVSGGITRVETCFESTYDLIKKECLEQAGGYLFFRKSNGRNYVDWLTSMPYSCNQPVEFGLNLLDFASTFDGSSIVTCVAPIGEVIDEETGVVLTVADINDGSPVIEGSGVSYYGKITKTVKYPGVTDPELLYQLGRQYLMDQQFNKTSIECSAAELHFKNDNYTPFRVGQSIRCRSTPHFMDHTFQLTRMELDLDTGAKQITLGTPSHKTLTQIVPDEEEEEEEESLEELEQRVETVETGLANLANQIAQHGWLHQIDGVTQQTGTINFVSIGTEL